MRRSCQPEFLQHMAIRMLMQRRLFCPLFVCCFPCGGFQLNLHARTLGTTINETVQTAGVESILAIIYTVANGKDRVYFGPAAR